MGPLHNLAQPHAHSRTARPLSTEAVTISREMAPERHDRGPYGGAIRRMRSLAICSGHITDSGTQLPRSAFLRPAATSLRYKFYACAQERCGRLPWALLAI